jgi:hypothetical protein
MIPINPLVPNIPSPQYLQYIEFVFHNFKNPFMNERDKILVNKVNPPWSIHITMFAMPIRIPLFFCHDYHLLISSLVGFFLAYILLMPLLGVQLNVERLLSRLIYAFYTKELQLSLNVVKNSSRELHHHPWLIQRDTHIDGLALELISVFLHFLSMFFRRYYHFMSLSSS